MRKLLICILALCLSIGCLPADAHAGFWGVAGEKGVAKTGQTTSYKDYDDGYYQKGPPSSGARFTDVGDNTILDNVTGLQWVNRPELIIPHGLNANDVGVNRGDWITDTAYLAGDLVTDPNYTTWICLIPNSHSAAYFATERAANPTYWQQSIWATSNGSGDVNPNYMVWDSSQGTPDALSACHGMVAGGYADWRLPNINELQSIVNYGTSSPTSYSTYFPNTMSDYYWSGTTDADWSVYAWVVSFDYGGVVYGVKTSHYYVRPVRSSQ